MKPFKVLQVGSENLEANLEHISRIKWFYLDESLLDEISCPTPSIENLLTINYDLIIVRTKYTPSLKRLFDMIGKPYNILVDYRYWDEIYFTFKRLQIMMINYDVDETLINKLISISFPGQYGDKIPPRYAIVHPSFEGKAEYRGNKEIKIAGDFGEDFNQIIIWRNNMRYEKEKVIEIFPEYRVEGTVELEFVFRVIKDGTTDDIVEEKIVTHPNSKHAIEIERRNFDANISLSLRAKGEGTLYIGAVHRRWSRLEYGQFLLGGKIFRDEERNEFIYYFNPGNLEPPLNVYFSGYRPAEGFEGYFMMDQLNAPFLLIADPRIEGGAFYIGSEMYEKGILDIINHYLEYLEFKRSDLILSGLSMGSFGALYFGAQLNPKAIIVGKPLINIGTIAQNMKLVRPEDFGTSLDILLANTKGTSSLHIEELNNKFWDVFNKNNFADTTFAIAYMKHDDYDFYAFDELFEVLTRRNVRVLHRGFVGRHNDDSSSIINWFLNFYHLILKNDFGR